MTTCREDVPPNLSVQGGLGQQRAPATYFTRPPRRRSPHHSRHAWRARSDLPCLPRTIGRLAGVFFLLTILLGAAGESIYARLIAPEDATATAANLLAHTPLLRLGFASYLVEMALHDIAMTALFYELLRPVSRSISLLAAFFSLVGIAVKTFSRLFFVAPVAVLGDSDYLGAFTAEQRQALALVLLKLNAQGAPLLWCSSASMPC